MNIVLIGHEGYLGSSLLTYLQRRHRVIGWDKKENLFQLDASLLARENIEAVINLSVVANLQSKAFQIDTPSDEINVNGARHLARILKGSEIAWFQFSTREVLSAVYELKDVTMTEAGYRPKFLVDESYPYAPRNAYGKSKVIAEFISESHPFSNVIRLTSPYTDHYNPLGGWVLQLTKKIVAGDSITLTGGGEQFRDPLHIDDLGHFMELVCEHKVFGEKFHVGGGEKNLISLKEFVLTADPAAKVVIAEGGDYGFGFENAKAHRLTGWEPQILIRERIPLIVENVRRAMKG